MLPNSVSIVQKSTATTEVQVRLGNSQVFRASKSPSWTRSRVVLNDRVKLLIKHGVQLLKCNISLFCLESYCFLLGVVNVFVHRDTFKGDGEAPPTRDCNIVSTCTAMEEGVFWPLNIRKRDQVKREWGAGGSGRAAIEVGRYPRSKPRNLRNSQAEKGVLCRQHLRYEFGNLARDKCPLSIIPISKGRGCVVKWCCLLGKCETPKRSERWQSRYELTRKNTNPEN